MVELLRNMIQQVRDFGLESVFKRYYSVYRAQVVSNEDDTGRGLIEIKVPNLFGDKALPQKAEPKDFRGAGKGKGEFYPPDVDDWVYVEFEMGDPKFPIYSGGWHGESELPDEFTYSGAPTSRGFKNKYGHVFKFSEVEGEEQIIFSTPAGHFIVIDDTSGKEGLYFIHKSGAQIQIDNIGVKLVTEGGNYVAMSDEDGSAVVGSKSGAGVAVTEDVTLLDSSGNTVLSIKDGLAQLTTNGDVILSGASFTVDAGSCAMTDKIAKVTVAQGKIAMGIPGIELLDLYSQGLDAIMKLTVGTGTGPSSPPINLAEFMAIKILLTIIKGSL